MDKNSEKTGRMVTSDDFKETVSENLRKLIKKHDITQKELAQITGFAESTVSYYFKADKFPSMDFFLALKAKYNIVIDDFITKDIDSAKIVPQMIENKYDIREYGTYRKYVGSYLTYYFDTSEYKGRDYNDEFESLMYGILIIYEDVTSFNNSEFKCIAVFGLDNREMTENLKRKLDAVDKISDIISFIDKNYQMYAYKGDFELSGSHGFISLEHGDRDKVNITIHKPNSNKERYIAGIGTINSVSKGREPMPCIQFIGLSREKVELSEEEIHQQLLLHYPTLKAKEETEELIKLFKSMYLSSDEHISKMTDTQKALVIEGNLEEMIKKILQRNIFRSAKISNRDDDEWFKLIRRNMLPMDENKYKL